LGLSALAALGVSAACNNQAPTPTTPTQQPTIGTSAVPSAAPTALPTTSPTATPALEGADFQDDFNGPSIDESKWIALKQTGLILMQNGRVELLNGGNQPNYPFFATKEDIFPKAGSFFFEINFEYLATGAPISFNLDYYPPEKPGQDGLTMPFMRTTNVATALRMTFRTEAGEPFVDTPLEATRIGAHTLRIEYDEPTQTYHVLFDGAERGTVKSKRRPLKFWMGNYPNRDVTPTSWPRIAIDYVKAGVLGSPSANPQ
jgi:hypothetical protein